MAHSLPPPYEAIEMHDASTGEYHRKILGASAPLLDSPERDYQLESTFADVTRNGIKVVKNPTKRNYGPFSFAVRDAQLDSLLLEGAVDYNCEAHFTGLTGSPLFAIRSTREGQSWVFTVGSNVAWIGSIRIQGTLITMTTSDKSKVYKVNVIGTRDIIVSVGDTGMYITKINISPSDPSECSIQIRDGQPSMSAVEKAMSVSVAVAYMMATNGPVTTPDEHKANECAGNCAGICVVVVIILAFAGFIAFLVSNECKWKPYKAGCTNAG